MRVQSCKAKGRNFQKVIEEDIKMAYSDRLSGNDVRSVSMGCGGEDILLSPLAEALFPYSIECKCQERLNVWAAVEQAVANCPAGRTPLVAIKRNRQKAYAVVPWGHFLRLQRVSNNAMQPHAGAARPTANAQ